MLTTSTDKPLSENYTVATRWTRVAKPIHFWSDSKYPKNTADFHGECLFLQELQRLLETYELLQKLCVMLTLYAVAFQVKSDEMAGVSLLNSIIQIALFERLPKLPPPHIENKQEKIPFFHSHPKIKAGEIVGCILKTETPKSSFFY